jgi:LysM domain-containing protein
MRYEQAFDKSVDTERLFVLQCGSSEHVFEKGDAMSVALELEYEAFHPSLRIVPDIPGRTGPSARVQRRRVILGVVVVALLVLLMLPITALGGRTIGGSAPVAGQEYVVRSGDTLASIAERVGAGNVAGLERQLAAEAGSSVVVPGEHLLIP